MKKIRKIISSVIAVAMIVTSTPLVPIFASNAPLVDANFDFDVNVSFKENSGNGSQVVNVDWDSVNFKYADGSSPSTNYYVVRQKIDSDNVSNTSGEYKWELRGNYDQVKSINVLNIYPDISGSDGLASWMNSLKSKYPEKINMNVDKVKITDFNNNPSNYLKVVDGKYNYDVVVFGFWDSNYKKDLNSKSSGIVQDFINQDGGVIFGHDTIQYTSSGKLQHPYFSNLVMNNMGIITSEKSYANWCYSNKIEVTQQGTLTTYPFDIYGKSLIIPLSHTIGQFPLDESNVYMSFAKNYYTSNGKGPYYNYDINPIYGLKDSSTVNIGGKNYIGNAYLILDGNTAFIQSGHSSGKTNEAEQMVLANTIYSLVQVNQETESVDLVLDTRRPTAPVVTADKNLLSFTSEDKGSEYIYKAIAAPKGASVSSNWTEIQNALSNSALESTWIDANGYQYAFSSVSETQNVKAGIKTVDTFEYYIDTNPIGQKRDGRKLSLGSNYTIPSLSEGLTKDQYLHIWSYDNANNFSAGNLENTVLSGVATSVTNGVTNVNLYDVLASFDVTVNYQDLASNKIADSKTTSQKYGTVFSPEVLSLEGYNYNSSDPKAFLTVDDIKEITHKYDKLLTKKIYVVEHERDSLGNDISTPKVHLYKTITNVEGGMVNYQLPTHSRYKFLGYTVQESTGEILNNNEYTDGISCSFPWINEDSVYLHYDAIPADVTVNVIDSANGITYGTQTYNSYVGKTLTISDVYTKIPILNRSNENVASGYTNNKELMQKYSVYVTSDNSDDIIIDLLPRQKNISYYGIQYKGDSVTETRVNTSGAGISVGRNESAENVKQLGTQIVYFDGESLTKNIEDIDGNKINSLQDTTGVETNENYWKQNWLTTGIGNPVVEFGDSNLMTYVGFYKGNLPNEVYDYVLSYNSVVPNSEELASSVLVSTAVPNIRPIDVKSFNDITIDGVDGIDFVVDYIVLTDANKLSDVKFFGDGQKYTFGQFYSHLPKTDVNGNLLSDSYIVDIYYRPKVEVLYNEYLTDANGENPVLTSNKKFDVEYMQNGVYKNTMPKEKYVIQKAFVDGVQVNDPNVIADKYSKSIDVYYRPLTYDLTVKVVNKSSKSTTRNYQAYTFTDVALDENVMFNIPTFNSYTYDGLVVGEGTSIDDITIDGEKVVFDPSIEGNYTMELNYKQDAELSVMYTVYKNGKYDVVMEKEIPVFVGDKYNFTLPNNYVGYDLDTVYFEGVVYNVDDENGNVNIEEGDVSTDKEYSYLVNKSHTTIYLVYVPTTKYNVILNTNVNGAAILSGAGSYLYDVNVSISADINEGYEFIGWTKTSGADVDFKDMTTDEIGSGNRTDTLAPVFNMPSGDVVLTAEFRKTDEEIEDDSDEDNIKVIIDTKPNKPLEPESKIQKPEPPKKPQIPSKEDIYSLVDNEYYQELRETAPYINGYPTGLVEPSSNVTRAEVVEIIYNLYGNGYESDKESLSKVSDVYGSDWYSSSIAFAIDFGIVNGYSDGTFRPDQNITRAELASIIAKFVRPTNDEDITTFTDTKDSWASDSIEILVDKGVVGGYADGTFKPNQNTTRAELVVFINRLIGRELTYDEKIIFPDLPQTHWAYDHMMNASNGGIVKE